MAGTATAAEETAAGERLTLALESVKAAKGIAAGEKKALSRWAVEVFFQPAVAANKSGGAGDDQQLEQFAEDYKELMAQAGHKACDILPSKVANDVRSLMRARGAKVHPVGKGKCKRVLQEAQEAIKRHKGKGKSQGGVASDGGKLCDAIMVFGMPEQNTTDEELSSDSGKDQQEPEEELAGNTSTGAGTQFFDLYDENSDIADDDSGQAYEAWLISALWSRRIEADIQADVIAAQAHIEGKCMIDIDTPPNKESKCMVDIGTQRTVQAEEQVQAATPQIQGQKPGGGKVQEQEQVQEQQGEQVQQVQPAQLLQQLRRNREGGGQFQEQEQIQGGRAQEAEEAKGQRGQGEAEEAKGQRGQGGQGRGRGRASSRRAVAERETVGRKGQKDQEGEEGEKGGGKKREAGRVINTVNARREQTLPKSCEKINCPREVSRTIDLNRQLLTEHQEQEQRQRSKEGTTGVGQGICYEHSFSFQALQSEEQEQEQDPEPVFAEDNDQRVQWLTQMIEKRKSKPGIAEETAKEMHGYFADIGFSWEGFRRDLSAADPKGLKTAVWTLQDIFEKGKDKGQFAVAAGRCSRQVQQAVLQVQQEQMGATCVGMDSIVMALATAHL